MKVDYLKAKSLGLCPNSMLLAELLHKKDFDGIKEFSTLVPKSEGGRLFKLLKDKGYVVNNNPNDPLDVSIIFLVKKRKKSSSEKTEFDSFIELYQDLFPRGITSGGYPIRSSIGACSKKMLTFLDQYKQFSKELILEATKQYVERFRRNGFNGIKLAHYFISKDGISVLEGECEMLLSGESKNNDFSIDV